jgi:hypothetical protein
MTEHQGRLIVASGFEYVAGVPALRAAAFDGQTWTELPGLGGTPKSLAVRNGDLYASGLIGTAGGQPATGIAWWTGSQWQPFGNISGPLARPHCVAAHRGELIVGGYFHYADNLPTRNVARFASTPWIARDPLPQSAAQGAGASFTVAAASGHENLTYSWRRSGVPLTDGATPHGSIISGAGTNTLSISGIRPQDAGDYTCTISNTCGSHASQPAALTVIGATCYPNCDASTTAPVLNVADFTCFLQRFAAGDTYANCDNSTTDPVLNAADLTRFLQRFAGCP